MAKVKLIMEYSREDSGDDSSVGNVDLILFLLIMGRFFAQLNYTYKIIPYDIQLLHAMSGAIMFVLVLSMLLILMRNVSLYLLRYKVFMLFLFYLILSALFNGDAGAQKYVEAVSYILILIFVVSFASIYVSYRYLQWFIILFLVIIILQLLFSFYQHGLFYFNSRQNRGGIGSFFGHANSAAFFVSILLFVLYNSKGRRALFVKIFFITLLFLLGTRSVFLVTCTLLVSLKVSEYLDDSTLIVLLGFVVLSVAIGFYINYIVEQSWNTQSSMLSGNSMKWRVRHWLYYIERITTTNQLIFGQGLASHEDVPRFFYNRYFEVHNDFLKITYDIGVLGLFLYLWADLSITLACLKQVVDKRQRNCLLAIYLVKAFFMFFDNLVTNFCGTMVYYYIISNFQEIVQEIEMRAQSGSWLITRFDR